MSENINIEKDDENFLFGKNREMPFAVPAQYFNSLEQRIINKIEAMEELNEFSILSAIDKQKEFIIPENYFSKAENKIEYQVELAEFNVLNKIAKPAFNTLPEEYQNSLTERIVNKVELQEELKEFATLYSLTKQNAFEIRADYFDSLADTIKERIAGKNNTRVSLIEKFIFSIINPKFVISFGIVVITGIATVFYFKNKNTSGTDGDCKTLACLEKKEMLNEHTIREMDDDNLYDMVDVDMLDEQISKGKTTDSVTEKKNKK